MFHLFAACCARLWWRGRAVHASLCSKIGQNRYLPISLDKCFSIFNFFGRLYSASDLKMLYRLRMLIFNFLDDRHQERCCFCVFSVLFHLAANFSRRICIFCERNFFYASASVCRWGRPFQIYQTNFWLLRATACWAQERASGCNGKTLKIFKTTTGFLMPGRPKTTRIIIATPPIGCADG